MPVFDFLAVREQRVRFSVTADTEEEAQTLAQTRFAGIDFKTEDESDDPGELSLEGET